MKKLFVNLLISPTTVKEWRISNLSKSNIPTFDTLSLTELIEKSKLKGNI
jgi:hypothetical protein